MQGSPFVSYVFVEFCNNSDLAVDTRFGKDIFYVSFDSMYAYAKLISDFLISPILVRYSLLSAALGW